MEGRKEGRRKTGREEKRKEDRKQGWKEGSKGCRKEGERRPQRKTEQAGLPGALAHLKLFTGAGRDFMGLKQRFCCCSFVLILPCLSLRVELDLLFLTSFPTKTEKTTEGQAMSFGSGFPGELLLC